MRILILLFPANVFDSLMDWWMNRMNCVLGNRRNDDSICYRKGGLCEFENTVETHFSLTTD
jgi:hypothetical protein